MLSDPQSALLLLRHCHVTRLNYLARSVSPVLLKSAADCHDTMSKVTCEKLLDFPLESEKWIQATLPVKHGGLGLTSVKAISLFAFVSAWMHTLNRLPNRFQDSNRLIDSVIQGISPIGSTRHDAMPTGKSIEDLISDSHKLQKKLTQTYMSRQLEVK